MRTYFLTWLIAFVLTASLHAQSDTCKTVRMADIGWSDVTATTALTAELLAALGYEAKISLLATPVTFASLKNHDIDVFLGNWMPSMEADIRPYLSDNSVVQLHKNLKGAHYSLAVPRYVYEAGVKSLQDLHRFSTDFDKKIYGIEPGNDGNRLILKMIDDPALMLSGWEVVESSEQGMLSEVHNAIEKKQFIAFLAWSPHPMNLSIKFDYLTGGDDYFGKNFGAAQVYTVTRSGFSDDCPTLYQFFKKLTFDLDLENQMMSLMLEEKLTPQKAAQRFLQENRLRSAQLVRSITKSQEEALSLIDAQIAFRQNNADGNPKIPLGKWAQTTINFITMQFGAELHFFSQRIETLVRFIIQAILSLHWAIVLAMWLLVAYGARRSFSLCLLIACGILLIINLNLWTQTIETLVMVLLASIFSLALGVPLGIIAAHCPKFHRLLQPLLDLMQTLPTFVYLIPSLMLFGLGVVPGLLATVIFAVAAPIRLTILGVSCMPKEIKEAADSLGASALQRLIKFELPWAAPSIMAGFTQCIMLSLSMVVIAALVGADGLGNSVVRALNTVNIQQGCEAGAAIVILAIILDRSLRFSGPHADQQR